MPIVLVPWSHAQTFIHQIDGERHHGPILPWTWGKQRSRRQVSAGGTGRGWLAQGLLTLLCGTPLPPNLFCLA